MGAVTVKLETMSILVDTEELEWLQSRLAARPPDHETTAIIEKLHQV